MNFTRKSRRGGSLFGRKTTPSVSQLEARRNFNVAHSKSRVANVLSRPGQLSYTNKEAIRARYETAIQQLKSIERPSETAGALKQVSDSLGSALKSQTVRETGAVVITIPVGVAQLAFKALRLFLSIFVLLFDLGAGFISGSPTVNLAAAVAPNSRFNTTLSAYQKARTFTGAKPVVTTVKNYA